VSPPSRLRIGLVACAKTKLAHPAQAQDLYTSPLFRSAAWYCREVYDCWYILSAKHGVVPPSVELQPYDLTLTDLSPDERWAWGTSVTESLRRRHPGRHEWYLHAGGVYRKPIERRLDGYVEVPLSGRMIGEQLHWYRLRQRGIVPLPDWVRSAGQALAASRAPTPS
jgi:hypothetical protein